MMQTWSIKFNGTLESTRKMSGSGITGVVDVRATTLDEALAKFNLIFNKPMVRITSIQGDGDA